MMNISGNYDTANDEIIAVRAYLDREKIPYTSIRKYNEASAGDIMVIFPNNTYSLFEVKQESDQRFSKYGEYGIDFISSLVFKNSADKNRWKKINSPSEFDNFFSAIDYLHPNFKWGKIYYSYSDIWLFYVKDSATGEFTHLEAYNGKKLHDMDLFTYLKNNCEFAVNIKGENQMSHSDRHDSATFYIKPEKLSIAKATKDDIAHNYPFCLHLSGTQPDERPSCPRCGTVMILRRNQINGHSFWGCVNYPSCKYTEMYNPKRQ